MFAPEESVTVPLVVFVSATDPARIALAVPLSTENETVLVNTPVELVIEPLVSVTAPTESLKVVRLKVPPLTVRPPVLNALLAPSASVPALTVVRPV